MRYAFLACAVVCAVLASCQCGRPDDNPDGGPDGGGGGGSCADVTALSVTPASASATASATAGGSASFTAIGQTARGDRDLTAQVSWAASRDDDTPAGSISGGVYQGPPGVGGKVRITAQDSCGHSAEATLTLQINAVFNDPGPSTTGRFDGPVVTGNATHGPEIVYPSDQTRFPRNIYKILFQWKKKDADQFRLTFQGASGGQTVVYTNGVHPQCQSSTVGACWQANSATWEAIAGSFAGSTATLVIDAVVPGDSNVYRSAPVTLGFSRRDVRGAIFYWSTTTKGIRRASVSDADPESYLVALPTPTVLDGGLTVACVACHTVSRSGQKIVGYTQTSGPDGIMVYDVTRISPPTLRIATGINSARGFGTFSPDDHRLVATVGNLMAEFDVSTGAKVATLPPVEGTNPDWSPNGGDLAYSDQGGDSPGNANLSVITQGAGADGGWGNARIIVPAAGKTNLFPSYTWDGQYLAFSRGKGGHGDVTLQLQLVRANGGTPVDLVNANRVVNNQLTLGNYENNMPTWAPPGDLEWVAFNSLRPYGVVYPNGGTQQIWVAAVDRSRFDGGLDPSYPAFRFAFQALAENNHRAFWTEDIRALPDAGNPCDPLGQVCNPSAARCCGSATCQPNSELSYTCQLDAGSGGTCLPYDAPCSQTSGASCCTGLVCDTAADGGYTCRATIG